jgi:hypothetical protein
MKFVIAILLATTVVVALLVKFGPLHHYIFGETIAPSNLISVEREVLISDIATEPHAVIQTADGHFIIAGERGGLSAVALTSNGDKLWQYEPSDPGAYPNWSKYTGVVPLASGNLLFCGERRFQSAETPLITVLSPAGVLISSNGVFPKDDPSQHAEAFTQCFPSEGGALLFGNVHNPLSTVNSWKRDFRWVLKVDENGKKEWETVGDGTDYMKPPFAPPAPTSSGATLSWLQPIQNGGPVLGVLHFTRVSSTGDVTGTRDIECNFFLLQFDTVTPSDNTSFLCAPYGAKMKLFRINDRLQDLTSPIELEDILRGRFTAQLGRGYVLDDGSMLIFGRIGTQSGDQATMQLFSSAGRSLGFRVFDMTYRSFTVGYVFPLGGRRFLALRPSERGMVMSWVTVN